MESLYVPSAMRRVSPEDMEEIQEGTLGQLPGWRSVTAETFSTTKNVPINEKRAKTENEKDFFCFMNLQRNLGISNECSFSLIIKICYFNRG